MLPSKLYIIFSTYHEAIRKASYDLILYQESCPHGNISFTFKKKKRCYIPLFKNIGIKCIFLNNVYFKNLVFGTESSPRKTPPREISPE